MDEFELMASHAAHAQAACAKLSQRLSGTPCVPEVQRHLTALYHQYVAANFVMVSLNDAVADARQRGVKI